MNGDRCGDPVMNPLRTGVVGRRRKPEITKLGAQFLQKFRRFRQRCHWIIHIEQATLARSSRHELGNSLRPLAAAGEGPRRVLLKSTLLPNQPREKLDWEPMRLRRQIDQEADRGRRVRWRRALRGPVPVELLVAKALVRSARSRCASVGWIALLRNRSQRQP